MTVLRYDNMREQMLSIPQWAKAERMEISTPLARLWNLPGFAKKIKEKKTRIFNPRVINARKGIHLIQNDVDTRKCS